MNYTELIPIPAASAINTGIEPCPTGLIERRFGLPISPLPKDCAVVSTLDPDWRKRFTTADVGPFRVTGHRMAVDLLKRSLAVVRKEKSGLYNVLGSAGMLCARHVRGHPGLASNHTFGLAIDFTLAGALDEPGNDMCQRGLLELYSIMKSFGWFWGAEFGREDAMHFEVGSRVVRDWIARRVF